MTAFFLKFLQPYAFMLLGMSYSLQQALEGLGINPTRFEPWTDASGSIIGSTLNLDASLALPILAVVVFYFVWFMVVTRALRALWGRRAMWLGVFLLTLPGVLSLIGAWPQIQWLPRTYVIGSGHVGSPLGMLLLQVFAMSTGWALTVWTTCRLKLDDRFRHGYDQFWYALAISAGLFFVADLDANGQRDELRQSVATSRAASSYLLDQVRRLDVACQSGSVKLTLACKWAVSSQWELESYAHFGERLYWQLGPEHDWRIYTGSDPTQNDTAVDALRQELHQYNLKVCPVTDLGGGFSQASRVSSSCQIPPADFCTSFPSRKLAGMDHTYGPGRTVAIANECIVPTLYRLKVEQESLAGAVGDSEKARNLRSMFFVFVALIAGGKVANASVRMTEAIRRHRDLNTSAPGKATPRTHPRLSRLLSRLKSGFHWAWMSVVRQLGK